VNRTCLVTGANGFVGMTLCRVLLVSGYTVHAAVRRDAAALPAGVRQFNTGDIGPDTDWSPALDGAEVVVHLAARVHVMRDDAADPLAAFRHVNLEGTRALAEAAAAAGVRRFIYISTIKVNGEGTGGVAPAQPYTA